VRSSRRILHHIRCFLGVQCLLGALLVGACAKSTAQTRPVPTQPAPGMASLLVLNFSEPTLIESRNSIYDGQRKIATVTERHYLVVQLAPGRHVLSCAGLPRGGTAVVEAVAGETYYFDVGMGPVNRVQACGFITQSDAEKWLPDMEPEGQD